MRAVPQLSTANASKVWCTLKLAGLILTVRSLSQSLECVCLLETCRSSCEHGIDDDVHEFQMPIRENFAAGREGCGMVGGGVGWGSFEDALIRIRLTIVAIGPRAMLCSFSLD